MRLNEFFTLLPGCQQVYLVYEEHIVSGEADSLSFILCEDVYKGDVTKVEAEGNVLKVWVKEAAERGTP